MSRVPRLMAISDRRSLGRPLEDWVRDLGNDIDAVQLREKDLTDLDLLQLAKRLRKIAADGISILVNGRADIALAAGSDGVHLTSSGLPIAAVSRGFGGRLLIGCSTHHPDEVAAAQRDGADYAVFGPVFPTPSKTAYGPPPGLEGLRQATAHGLPVLAIGGIDADRMTAVAEAGAAGIAAIRAFFDPESIARMAAIGRRLWPRAVS